MSEQNSEKRLVPVVGTIDVDAVDRREESPRSKVLGHIAGGRLDENSDEALQGAAAHNADTVVRQHRKIGELTEQRDGALKQSAELLDQVLRLEDRLSRLTSLGTPAPTSIDSALEQLFDAEAVFAGAECDARIARCAKFDAQLERDRAETAAMVRLVGTGGKRGELPVPGAMSPTEAKDHLEEDPQYLVLADALRERARQCDEHEVALRIAASRVETLRACVNAMAKHSPLTARAVALSRTQQ